MTDGEVLAAVQRARSSYRAAVTRANRRRDAAIAEAFAFFGSSDVEQAARGNAIQRAEGTRALAERRSGGPRRDFALCSSASGRDPACGLTSCRRFDLGRADEIRPLGRCVAMQADLKLVRRYDVGDLSDSLVLALEVRPSSDTERVALETHAELMSAERVGPDDAPAWQIKFPPR